MVLKTSQTLHIAAIHVAYVNMFIVLVAIQRLKKCVTLIDPLHTSIKCYVSPISVHTYIPFQADTLSVHKNAGF
jgi:hypothetical protein